MELPPRRQVPEKNLKHQHVRAMRVSRMATRKGDANGAAPEKKRKGRPKDVT